MARACQEHVKARLASEYFKNTTMIPEKEELLKLIEAIEDMPRMCAADWREKYPEAHQITQQTHPLEPLVVEHYSNRFQMRLQLDLQMKIAKVLVRIKGVSEPYEPRV